MLATFSRHLGVLPSVHRDIFGGNSGGSLFRLLQPELLFGRGHCLLPCIDEPSSIHRTGFYPPVVVLGSGFLPSRLLGPLQIMNPGGRLLLRYLVIHHHGRVVGTGCLLCSSNLECVIVPGRSRQACVNIWPLVGLFSVGDDNGPGSHGPSGQQLCVVSLQGGGGYVLTLRS